MITSLDYFGSAPDYMRDDDRAQLWREVALTVDVDSLTNRDAAQLWLEMACALLLQERQGALDDFGRYVLRDVLQDLLIDIRDIDRLMGNWSRCLIGRAANDELAGRIHEARAEIDPEILHRCESVNYKQACRLLNVEARQLRNLIADQKVKRIGEGRRNLRITTESLRQRLGIDPKKSGN